MTDRRLFRQLVESPDILVLPGVFNGYSVRLVERFGYKAAAISGAGISEGVLGWADRGILTFDENLRACRALADCCNIPLLADADADTGYGNALNVAISQGDLTVFFTRPLSATILVIAAAALLVPVATAYWQRRRRNQAATPATL